MQLAPDLDTGPAQLGRGGVCEGCAAEPLALLQRREKQAAARHPVGRVWPFSRRRPVRLTACGRLVGGEQPGGLQSSQQHEATGERTASANTALRKGGEWAFKVVLESCERGHFSQSRMLAAARRGASASPHGPGMHPHTLLSRMPMRSVDAVVVLQLCSAATAPVSRVAAFGRAAPASSAARRRGGTRALRIPSEGRRLERWSRASRQTRRRHPYPRPHP